MYLNTRMPLFHCQSRGVQFLGVQKGYAKDCFISKF